MPKTIKVRRAGFARVFNKPEFKKWLAEQPRKNLKYKGAVNKQGQGWLPEDFVLEAARRGLLLKIGTVYKWQQGAQPRYALLNIVRPVFPTVRFHH